MLTATFDKTFKFLAKTENPAAIDLLRVLLDDQDWQVKAQAFETLYLKRDNTIALELFGRILQDEENWMRTSAVNADRIAKLADTAIRSNDENLLKVAIDISLRHRIYDTLKSVLPFLESPREDIAKMAAAAILAFAEKFYEELAACTSATELRNFDRRREWFSEELEDSVRRFSMHGMIEPLKAFLLVTKKDYPSFLSVMGDHHSAASKTIMDLLENGEHPSYMRLLLSFVEDTSAPPQIDIIIGKRKDVKFVRNLLNYIGPAPNPQAKAAYKRFKDFIWLDVNNSDLPEMYKGLEPQFVQLITSISLPREKLLEMFRYVFSHCSPEGRRAAAEALKSMAGDDFNQLIIENVDDQDGATCSALLRLVKGRGFKESDQIIMRSVERNDPVVLQTLYELVPDFHVDSFLQKVDQLPEQVARALGRIVRKVDSDFDKTIALEFASTAAVRRIATIHAVKFAGISRDYQDILCRIVQNDEDMNVRTAACDSLSEVLTMEAIKTLKEATEDRSFALRNAALEAVNKWTALYQKMSSRKK
ncbi:MAG: HEAT repeat domain-containing protein [Thermoguttaceae bacterium]